MRMLSFSHQQLPRTKSGSKTWDAWNDHSSLCSLSCSCRVNTGVAGPLVLLPPSQDKPVLTQVQQARTVTASCWTAEAGCPVGGREWRLGGALFNNSRRFHPGPLLYIATVSEWCPRTTSGHGNVSSSSRPAAAALPFAIVSRGESS